MTYALLPGAGGDSFYWHLVAPRLRALGHAVLTPDLPTGDGRAGLAEYADAIVAAVGELAGVVLVAPMIPAPGDTPGARWETSGQSAARRELEECEGRDPDAPFDVRTTFLHDVDPPVVERILARGVGDVDVIDAGHLPAFGRPQELTDRLEAHRLAR